MGRPPKILITKIGFDGHDRGSRIVAAFLRDAGMEVVYTGPWQTVANVVSLALQEDVDVIGISSLAADHLILPKLMVALREAGLAHIGVVVGGIIPDSEMELLTSAGVAHIFHPGAARDDIVSKISALTVTARANAS
jgi:methylmalonyl-CoA mutase C-terminal domain/subunit